MQRLPTFALLTGVALLGNYLSVPLFFGVDFLFGSIATLLIAVLCGPLWALASAFIASAYTIVLWGHPYAIVIFPLEILFVAYFLRRGFDNIILLDSIYWLVLGMPLVWFFYGFVLDMDGKFTLLVMLKQAINGIFNALIASLILAVLQLNPFRKKTDGDNSPSVYDMLFILLTALVFLPSLSLMIIDSRQEKEQIESNIEQNLHLESLHIAHDLQSWYGQHLHAVQALAAAAAEVGLQPSAALQSRTRVIAKAFPDFHNMYVADASATTVGFYPPVNEKGESTIGISFADRDYYQELKRTGGAVLSGVFAGRGGIFEPIQTLSVPIMRDGQFQGFALGALDLSRERTMLAENVLHEMTDTVLLDHGTVIASNVEALKPLDRFDWRGRHDVVPVAGNMYQLLPPDAALPAMVRWQQSVYVKEVLPDERMPWHLVLRTPVAPYQAALYRTYIVNLGLVCVLLAVAFALAGLVSWQFTRPLKRLARTTTNLPERIAAGQRIEWPHGLFREVNTLIRNFRVTSGNLAHRFGEIRDDKERLRTLVETLPVGICVLDRDIHCTLANTLGEQYCALLADKGEDGCLLTLGGEPVTDILEACRDGARSHELTLEQPTRRIFEVGADAFVGDEKGDGHVLIIREVTDEWETLAREKDLEGQLHQAQKMESIGRLAGGVAHDFNNMLSVIEGYTELVLDRLPPDAEVREDLEEVRNSARRSTLLTKQLLGFARRQPVQVRVLDLNETIADMLSMLKRLIGEDIELIWRPARDLWPVNVDPGQIDQILANLVVNARDAMARHGRLAIETANVEVTEEDARRKPGLKAGCYVRLRVQDSGKGMDEDLQRHVFEPFFTTKSEGEGTGLGLSTVYGIVKQNDGHIELESRPAEGTTFTICLPRFEGQEGGETDPSVAKQTVRHAPRGSETILVVEDEQALLRLAQRMLSRLGYHVLAAQSPTEAIKLAEEYDGEMHVLFTDMIMPEMNGNDLARAIKAFRPDISVLFTSGYTPDIVGRTRILGQTQSFIQKPYTTESLAQKIKEILD